MPTQLPFRPSVVFRLDVSPGACWPEPRDGEALEPQARRRRRPLTTTTIHTHPKHRHHHIASSSNTTGTYCSDEDHTSSSSRRTSNSETRKALVRSLDSLEVRAPAIAIVTVKHRSDTARSIATTSEIPSSPPLSLALYSHDYTYHR